MSKGDRDRSRRARERIAAQQAAARQAERRRRMLIAGGSVGLVLVVVLILVVVALSNHKKQAGSGTLPASVMHNITSVPASTLATVAQGADGAANYITAAICEMTGNQPASVCAASPIPAMEGKI